MALEAGLPADLHVVADDRRSRDPDERGDRGVLADAAVVPDLAQVVDLGAVADRRHAGLRPVDAGVRADLDVVAELDRADLRDLVERAVEERPAEAVAADHGAGLQHDAIAQRAAVGDVGARVEQAVRADRRAVAPIVTPGDSTLRSPTARARRSRPAADPDVRAERRGRIDGRGRVHERALRPRRFERGEQRGEREPRRRHGEDRFRIRRAGVEQRLVGQHRAGLRCERRAQIAFVGRERERGRVGVVDRGDALDREAGIADDPAAGPLRSSRRASAAGSRLGVAFSSILRIFSTSGVMSTPP